MKMFFTFLLSVVLCAGPALAENESKGERSRIESIFVGACTGAATAVIDAVTGDSISPGVWFVESNARASVVGSLSKADNVDMGVGQALAGAASWGVYFLTYSKLAPLINPAALALNPQIYLGLIGIRLVLPLLSSK